MLHEHTPRPAVSTILWRLAPPFLLFSVVLAGLMTVSWMFLLPRYTRIDVGGQLRDAAETRAYKAELTVEIATKEEERRQLVLAVHDKQYEALKQDRRDRVSLDNLRKQLTDHATAITGKADAVQWTGFDYDPAGKILKIRGAIQNVGTRSMTVLAEFAQSLTSLPFIKSATT